MRAAAVSPKIAVLRHRCSELDQCSAYDGCFPMLATSKVDFACPLARKPVALLNWWEHIKPGATFTPRSLFFSTARKTQMVAASLRLSSPAITHQHILYSALPPIALSASSVSSSHCSSMSRSRRFWLFGLHLSRPLTCSPGCTVSMSGR